MPVVKLIISCITGAIQVFENLSNGSLMSRTKDMHGTAQAKQVIVTWRGELLFFSVLLHMAVMLAQIECSHSSKLLACKILANCATGQPA